MRKNPRIANTILAIALSMAVLIFARVQGYPLPIERQPDLQIKKGNLSPTRVADSYEQQFRQVLKIIRDDFYDPNLNGVQLSHLEEQYRSRALAATSPAVFAETINQMLSTLHASHLHYTTNEEIDYYMLRAVRSLSLKSNEVEQIGVMGTATEQGYQVTAVLNGSPAARAGIFPGDLLLRANGQPFHSVASFRGKAGMEVSILLQRAGETKPRTVMVTPVRQDALGVFLDATKRSAQILSVEGMRIGYIHLWTMSNPAFLDALESLVQGQLADTQGLILDLRDGYGGSPFGYSDVFFRPDVRWMSQRRQGKGREDHTGYDKPMVVLINGGTRSAKEFLSYQLKVGKRATLVGTRTAGAFLGASFRDIEPDGLLELPVIGLRVDGKPLEGVGVMPDIDVASDPKHPEKDVQFLAAERTLLSAIRSRRAVDEDKLLRIW